MPKVMYIYLHEIIKITSIKRQGVEGMIEKIMYKANEKAFRVQDFTSGDNVDISKFVEGVNQRGKKQLQAQVCVLYKDEYTSLNQELESLRSEVQRLKHDLNDNAMQIKKLEKEIKDNKRANVDEVMQLKEEKYTITQDHQKEVSNLHQVISNLEKTHLQEREQLKETHANQLLAIDETHQKEIETLKEQYNAKLDEVNDKLLSQVQANKQTSDNLQGQILAMTQDHQREIDKLHQDLQTLESEHANEKLELTNKHAYDIEQLNEVISTLKQEHLEKINEKDKSHNDEREHIRNYFLKIVTLDNKEDVSELIEIEKSVPAILKPFMRKHVKQVEEMKERKLLKTPEMTINTYIESGEKEEQ